MTVESTSFLDGLNTAYPASGDQQAEGDDHLRLLKTVLKGTFPGRAGADSRVITKSAGYTPAATEVSAIYQHTAGLTVTLPAVAGVVSGAHYTFYAQTGSTTLTPNGADTVNGSASASLAQGEAAWLLPTTGNWILIRFSITSGADTTLSNLSNKATARANLGVEAAEVDVASATTTDIGAAASMNVRITGTTGITSLGTAAAGTVRNVRMAGALTLTHNATSLILPAGGANIATAAGDCFEAESLGSGNWVVRGYQKADGTSVIAAISEVTGVVKDYVGTTAPAGYVLLSGRTIGSASSGATERANADTQALYTLLWNSMSNTEAAVTGGRGASAAADFAANKPIALPDARGRVVAGADNMGGTTASRLTSGGSGITGTTLGAAGGAEAVTLTAAQSGLPSHSHSITYVQNNANTDFSLGGGNNGSTMSGTGSAGPSSASSAHSSTQPTLVLNKIIKL